MDGAEVRPELADSRRGARSVGGEFCVGYWACNENMEESRKRFGAIKEKMREIGFRNSLGKRLG